MPEIEKQSGAARELAYSRSSEEMGSEKAELWPLYFIGSGKNRAITADVVGACPGVMSRCSLPPAVSLDAVLEWPRTLTLSSYPFSPGIPFHDGVGAACVCVCIVMVWSWARLVFSPPK